MNARLILLGTLGASLSGFVACSQYSVDVAGPAQLVATGASHFDAGVVREGEGIEAEFRFENASQRNLTLSEPRMSCGCTDANLDKRILRPGEEGTLRVSVDTTNRPGNLLVSVWVLSEAPDQGALMFRVSALVGRPSSIEVEDSRIDFGDVVPDIGKTIATSVLARTRWGAELEPGLTWTLDGESQERFDVEFLPGTDIVAEGEFVTRRGELRIGFNATEVGRFQSRLVLHCEGRPNDATAEILLVAAVRAGIEFTKPAVFMDGLAVGECIGETIDVAWRDAAITKGFTAECSQDWLSCQMGEGGLHGLGTLEIKVCPPMAGLSSALLTLKDREKDAIVGSLAVTVFAR